ncbi:hypothetical protein KAW38_01620 [Candidatus Micrarchaeota archaeon]|nr:hypothetical protein [Candidatus Micrarchaeota archaeon]
MYKTKIEIPFEKVLFEALEKKSIGKRASAVVEKDKKNIIIKVSAKDSTSLRAILNAYLRELQIAEEI